MSGPCKCSVLHVFCPLSLLSLSLQLQHLLEQLIGGADTFEGNHDRSRAQLPVSKIEYVILGLTNQKEFLQSRLKLKWPRI